MKRKTFKRALAFFIGGVMALSLTACGDSTDKDEQITQETTQESEDENIGLVINDEDADPAGNDMAAIPVSASSIGNGSTAPVFKPGAEPQPGQETQPGEAPEPGGAPQSGTGVQAAHTHNFQGGNCSTPATCSCGATGDYGSHNWVTNTIHNDATGHYENKVTGTEQVVVGRQPIYTYYCGGEGGGTRVWTDEQGQQHVETGCNFSTTDRTAFDNHQQSAGHRGTTTLGGGYQDIYETRDIVENVWMQDSAAWDEKVTECSICGARQ